jgi:hypothetical protein
MTKQVLDRTEVLSVIATELGMCDVCASAEAWYHRGQGRVEVDLKAYLRGPEFRTLPRTEWLPTPRTVWAESTETAAHDKAEELFQEWVREIWLSLPSLSHAIQNVIPESNEELRALSAF